MTRPPPVAPFPALDLHILVVLGKAPLYGYAIMQAVEAESHGAVRPSVGTTYRALGRLSAAGFVAEADPEEPEAEHPGRERRYYDLTDAGRTALASELGRLASLLGTARERDLLPEPRQ